MVNQKSFFKISISFLLLQFPLWIYGLIFFSNRPIFNLDLIIPILIIRASKITALFFIIAIWIIDIGISSSYQFYFKSISDFFNSIKYLNTINYYNFLNLHTFFIFLISVVTLILFFYVNKCKQSSKNLLFNSFCICLFLILLDFLNGSFRTLPNDHTLTNFNISGSPAKILYQSYSSSSEIRKLRPIEKSPSFMNINDIKNWAISNSDRSIVYIVVESFGIFKNDALNDILNLKISSSLRSKYRISYEPIRFYGATTDAELRELCGITGSFQLLNSSNSALCLPSFLAHRSWQTIGIHGFSEAMFSRSDWWGYIGFTNRYFIEQLSNVVGNNNCGSVFKGACDGDMLDVGFNLSKGKKRFVYILTLNTHIPLDMDGTESSNLICKKNGLKLSACNLFIKLSNLLSTINMNIRNFDDGTYPLIIIVGDHAPPFSDASVRQEFSQSFVPRIVFQPIK